MSRSLSRLPILCIYPNQTSIRSSSHSKKIYTIRIPRRAALLSRVTVSKDALLFSLALPSRKVKGANCDFIYMPDLVNPSSDTLPSLSDGADAVKLLFATNDSHGGVIIDMKTPMDPEAFISSLRASIRHWRKEGKKGIWIKLPIELVSLVQIAVKEGFWYHHAETAYLMLVYWIPDTVHTLPVNASHRVGVGAFVMNDKGEVLVVQEKGGKLQGKGVWKFPTGVINEGEDIYAGVVREVKEETGIDTEFVEVLAFRLRPLSSDIQKQESEIEASQWMPLEEYAAQPFVQNHELFKYIVDICLAKIGRGYTGFSPVCTKSSLSGKQSHLYLNSKDLKQHLRSGNESDTSVF